MGTQVTGGARRPYLPPELQPRVVGTTSHIKPRRSYVLDGTERTRVICSYVYGKRLKHWLAIDDAVFGAEQFGREPGELTDHFLLLDSSIGIADGERPLPYCEMAY
ncbi:HAD domain-containing protein [Paraburkholderia sp. 32]|uniref:HAD domain-containing protein n=1 Tax=Paraburkholderia sp. 32 TaxID=2991057 RepID=UPI003D1D47E7